MNYVRIAILLAVLAGLAAAGAWLYRLGGSHARAECAEAQAKVAKQQIADLAAADERARRAEDRLAEVLRRVKPAAPDVREAVRENPSDCAVQPDVAERLRRAVRESNESAR